MNENDNKFILTPVREYLAFAVLITAILLLRINRLSADPPIDLSVSQGVFTDPAQYISYARNMIHWGSFNPLHDYRLVFFLKSTTTLMALLVFKLFGVGYLQSNLVGLAFSFPTIILLYFAIRKIAGNIASLFFLLLIMFDYNQIFYGRLPFLENSLNFFAVLSFTILVYSRKYYAFVLSGLFLAAGIFFGKIIGLIFLFPFLCYALYDYYNDYRGQFNKFILNYGLFVAGFLSITIFWYFFSYRPMNSAVEGYVAEQAFNLYGSPESLIYFDKFIYNYLSFGITSRLFERMAIPSLLAIGSMLIFFYRINYREAWKEKLYGIKPGMVFFIMLSIAAYGSLMIWNYRPLRYQTILIYPIYALAGIFVSYLFDGFRSNFNMKKITAYPIIIFLLLIIPFYQIVRRVYKVYDWEFIYYDIAGILIIIMIVIVIGIFIIIRIKSELIHPPRWFKYIVISGAALATLGYGGAKYFHWNGSASYMTVTNAKDIETILSPEAIISGPYAAAFTQDNKFMNFIHMFGVADVDSSLFKHFPITHLLLDISNLEQAKIDYPKIMESGSSIVNYNIGGREVALIRVAGATGNVQANGYSLTPYEMALYAYNREDIPAGHEFMKLQAGRNPVGRSFNLTSATLADNNGFYQEAEYYFRKALDFAPTDFFLHFKMGEFYIGMYKKTGNPEFRKKAIEQLNLARKYNEGSGKLERDIPKLLEEGAHSGS